MARVFNCVFPQGTTVRSRATGMVGHHSWCDGSVLIAHSLTYLFVSSACLLIKSVLVLGLDPRGFLTVVQTPLFECVFPKLVNSVCSSLVLLGWYFLSFWVGKQVLSQFGTWWPYQVGSGFGGASARLQQGHLKRHQLDMNSAKQLPHGDGASSLSAGGQ